MSSSDESDDDQTGRNPAVQSSDDSASDSEHDEKPQDSASRLDLIVDKYLLHMENFYGREIIELFTIRSSRTVRHLTYHTVTKSHLPLYCSRVLIESVYFYGVYFVELDQNDSSPHSRRFMNSDA